MEDLQNNYEKNELDLIVSGLLSNKGKNLSEIQALQQKNKEIDTLLAKFGHETSKSTKKRTNSWKSYITNILQDSTRILTRDDIYKIFCERFKDVTKDIGAKKCRNSLSSSYSRMVENEDLFTVRNNTGQLRYGLSSWLKNENEFHKILIRLQEVANIQTFTFDIDEPKAIRVLNSAVEASFYT